MSTPDPSRRDVLDPGPATPDPKVRPGGKYRICRTELRGRGADQHRVFTLPFDMRRFDDLGETQQHLARVRNQFKIAAFGEFAIQEIHPDGSVDAEPRNELETAAGPSSVTIVLEFDSNKPVPGYQELIQECMRPFGRITFLPDNTDGTAWNWGIEPPTVHRS